MRIQHNIMAMNAYRNYNNNTKALSGNLEKLSSGYKINRAGDDAAGLAISEKMRAQITGLDAAQKNVKDGVSLVKTAEGAMQEIQDMLNRMDYLATQSANGTYDNEVDRANLQKEVEALKTEIDRIADSANFNGIKLLNGKTGYTEGSIDIESVAGDPGYDGTVDISKYIGAQTASSTHESVAGNTTQSNPTFKISFDQLKIANTGTTAANVTVEFAGVSVTVSLATDGGANSNGAYTAGDFASAFATAFNSLDVTNGATATGGTVGQIGDFFFNATADAATGEITFTAKAVTGGAGGYAQMTTGTAANAEFTDAQADAINAALKGEIKIATDANSAITSANQHHNVFNVSEAVAITDPVKAGVDFKLSTDFVANGGKLQIDDKTFVFQTESGSTPTTAAGEELIDLTKYADQGTTALLNAAVNALNQKTTDKFQIEKVDGETIHIDQLKSSVTNGDVFDYEDLKGMFTPTGVVKDAVAPATDITINNPSNGTKVTVGDKTYALVKEATGKAAEGVTEVVMGNDAAAALQAALEQDGFEAEVTDEGKVRVYADDATATSGPSVKFNGPGLKLQIGDTSDSFNQMGVEIGDMHVKAMGTGKYLDEDGNEVEVSKTIADIDISKQDTAAEAVQVIKNAINYVSGVRGDLGAIQNRLEHTGNNLSVMAENIQDAESTIRDTDVASEMMSYVKNNILVQSAQAMLAQANQVPQGVLQLLG